MPYPPFSETSKPVCRELFDRFRRRDIEFADGLNGSLAQTAAAKRSEGTSKRMWFMISEVSASWEYNQHARRKNTVCHKVVTHVL